ncbi:hypothetical protein MUK42_03083, partial [Musa troglodytarum]
MERERCARALREQAPTTTTTTKPERTWSSRAMEQGRKEKVRGRCARTSDPPSREEKAAAAAAEEGAMLPPPWTKLLCLSNSKDLQFIFDIRTATLLTGRSRSIGGGLGFQDRCRPLELDWDRCMLLNEI